MKHILNAEAMVRENSRQPADLSATLDAAEYRAAGLDKLVGMAAGMADDERIIAMAARGVRRQGHSQPVSIADRWHIGSVTKSLTAVLIGTLVAEGRLNLDMPVPELLPDIDHMDAEWAGVTLRDVLEHRAGLPANFGPKTMEIAAPDEAARPTLRRNALAEILSKPPQARLYLYSNIGFTLAGHVVENILNKPWEIALRERVFAALGLECAGFGAPKGESRLDQPWGHASFLGYWRRAIDPSRAQADNSPVIGPAGTVHMSLSDLLRFGQALLRMAKGEDDILPAATFANLFTPGHGNYAGGLISDNDPTSGTDFIWHNGSNGMWYALLIILPTKNRVIAVTANELGHHTHDIVWNIAWQLDGLADAGTTLQPKALDQVSRAQKRAPNTLDDMNGNDLIDGPDPRKEME